MAITKLTTDSDLDLEAYLAAYPSETYNNSTLPAGLVRQLSFNKVNTKLNLAIDEINAASLEYAYSTSASGIKVAETTLTAAEIVGNAAGALNHADGAILVAAAAAGSVHEFISATLFYEYDTAAYTGGGNDTVINVGVTGAQVAFSSVIGSADLIKAAGNKIVQVNALNATDQALTITGANVISLYSTTIWTQPGTAAGTLRCVVTYRTIVTGL